MSRAARRCIIEGRADGRAGRSKNWVSCCRRCAPPLSRACPGDASAWPRCRGDALAHGEGRAVDLSRGTRWPGPFRLTRPVTFRPDRRAGVNWPGGRLRSGRWTSPKGEAPGAPLPGSSAQQRPGQDSIRPRLHPEIQRSFVQHSPAPYFKLGCHGTHHALFKTNRRAGRPCKGCLQFVGMGIARGQTWINPR